MKATIESVYLISSHREKCAAILEKDNISENEIIDFLISLHIVLEVSLNTFLRQLYRMIHPFNLEFFEDLEILKNLDNINFIDKTTLFIYTGNFAFLNKEKTKEYSKIIDTLKTFSEIRNKLLHGHSISSISYGETKLNSKTKELLTSKFLEDQIRRFKYILDSLKYYLENLKSPLTESGKQALIDQYLNYSFLERSVS